MALRLFPINAKNRALPNGRATAPRPSARRLYTSAEFLYDNAALLPISQEDDQWPHRNQPEKN